MAMDSLEVANSKVKSLCGNSVQTCNDINGSENLGDDLLADLDSYLEDINDRLTISRMVSDSVIKGMVTAVTQEAAERIANKELEVVELKEAFYVLRSRADKKEISAILEKSVTAHDRMEGIFGSLGGDCREQLARLKNEISRIKGCSDMKRMSSGSELLGLGGLLQEQPSESWTEVDKMLNGLETTMGVVFKGVEEVVRSSTESRQEQELRSEIEALVTGTCIRSLEQEFEGKMWDRIHSDKATSWSGRMREISRLREELNSISKSLSGPESGQLISHGSLDSEGWYNGKRSHFHHSVSGNHLENGKHEESQNNNKSENSDPYYLGHLNRDELIAYYNNEMTKLKRNHESKVQEMTEEYFSLKREYLKEKGSSLHLKKDKELITLRNRIPEVISKLDVILVETEKIPEMPDEAESHSSLKVRLEILLAENRQLRDYLSDRKKEVRCLATQVLDATERTSQHTLSEAKLLNSIRCLKSNIEDLHIEASLGADVFAFLLGETTSQINRRLEDSRVEYNALHHYYESVIKDASCNTQPTSKCGAEDSDMISIIMQGISEVVFRESWREAKETHGMLTRKYVEQNEIRVSLEKRVLEIEKNLEIELADKERLKQEIHFLTEEKKRFAHEAEAALQSEKERLQLASKELESLKVQQRILISQSSLESEDLRCDLAGALEEVELYKSNICKLNEKLELAVEVFRETDEERRKLLALNLEKQKTISLHEANERETRKQMESMAVLVQGLSKAASDFESRVTKDISKNCSRLKNVSTQSRLVKQKANILKRTGLLYKQRLERRLADFQKAEAEVDLLGDEVDTLLSLLEKIYLALDHYSPVLQHYPGITETLKLVKRELSGVSARSAHSRG